MSRIDELYDAHELARERLIRARQSGAKADVVERLKENDAGLLEAIRQENIRRREKRRRR